MKSLAEGPQAKRNAPRQHCANSTSNAHVPRQLQRMMKESTATKRALCDFPFGPLGVLGPVLELAGADLKELVCGLAPE